jgi:hypothetical protein
VIPISIPTKELRLKSKREFSGNLFPEWIFSAVFLLIILGGCNRFPSLEGAKSAEGPELIRQAFPGWREDNREFPNASFNYNRESQFVYPALYVSPEQVTRLTDSEVVLITKAAPSSGGHIAQALLGAYWFNLKDGRWVLTRRQDEISWLGSSGDFGTVTLKRLATGVVGVFVEAGWAGGGTDSRWLEVFSVDSTGAKSILDGLTIYQSDDNAMALDCDALLKKPSGWQTQVTTEEVGGMNDRCMRLSATWAVVATNSTGYADILSRQRKSQVEVKTLSVRDTDEGYGQVGNYRLRLVQQDSNLIYRYVAEKRKYVLQAGRDLSERF